MKRNVKSVKLNWVAKPVFLLAAALSAYAAQAAIDLAAACKAGAILPAPTTSSSSRGIRDHVSSRGLKRSSNRTSG